MSCTTAPPGDEAGRLAWRPDRLRRIKRLIQLKSYHEITEESSPELIARLTREFAPLDVPALAESYLANGHPFVQANFVMLATDAWQRFRRSRA